MTRALREAIRSFTRRPLPSIVSVVTIGLSLYALGLFALVVLNLQQALERWRGEVELVAYLRDGMASEAVEGLKAGITDLDGVASVVYVSKDAALERARRDLQEFDDLLQDLAVNPLPASLEIRTAPAHRTREEIAALAGQIRNFRGVEDVRYASGWLERLDLVQAMAAGLALVLGGGFGLVALIIIANTVGLGLMAQTEEIEVMKLVGASPWTIRLPFMVEGLLKGVLGASLALGLLAATSWAVSRLLLPTAFLNPAQMGGTLAVGGGIGLGGSLIALRGHLKLP